MFLFSRLLFSSEYHNWKNHSCCNKIFQRMFMLLKVSDILKMSHTFFALLNKINAVKVCDATGDALKYKSPAPTNIFLVYFQFIF